MIFINHLESHTSSTLKVYNNLTALAERNDLYTGADFWFGFDSSNHTFLDIVGGKQPLAIKHGPILSLYQRTMEGEECNTYYIDVTNKKLILILEIKANLNAAHALRRLIPWSFIDTYTPNPEVLKNPKEQADIISCMLELLATNSWPNEELLQQVDRATKQITKEQPGLSLNLANIDRIKQQFIHKKEDKSAEHCVASYDPFLDNERLNIEFVKESNPARITVRSVQGNYPRIEIIAPGVPEIHEYHAVFARTSPKLYDDLQQALNKPEELVVLLQEHLPEMVSEYLKAHDLKKKEPVITPPTP